MLIIGHTALGIATGLLVSNPFAAFAVGVISHHVADAIPHYDPRSHVPLAIRKAQPIHIWTSRDVVIVAIDLLATLIMLGVFMTIVPFSYLPSIAAGIVGANLPDMLHNVPFWNRQLREIGWIRWWQDQIHRKLQWTLPAQLWYIGIATQAAVLAVTIWLVLGSSR